MFINIESKRRVKKEKKMKRLRIWSQEPQIIEICSVEFFKKYKSKWLEIFTVKRNVFYESSMPLQSALLHFQSWYGYISEFGQVQACQRNFLKIYISENLVRGILSSYNLNLPSLKISCKNIQQIWNSTEKHIFCKSEKKKVFR